MKVNKKYKQEFFFSSRCLKNFLYIFNSAIFLIKFPIKLKYNITKKYYLSYSIKNFINNINYIIM